MPCGAGGKASSGANVGAWKKRYLVGGFLENGLVLLLV